MTVSGFRVYEFPPTSRSEWRFWVYSGPKLIAKCRSRSQAERIVAALTVAHTDPTDQGGE